MFQKVYKKLLFSTGLLTYILFFTKKVHADIGKEWGDCVTQEGVATLSCIPVVFQNIVSAALFFLGAVAVFLIMLASFKYIASHGDPKQVEGAQKTLTYAILGVIIVLISFFIINFIARVTGAECIKFFGFSSC